MACATLSGVIATVSSVPVVACNVVATPARSWPVVGNDIPVAVNFVGMYCSFLINIIRQV
jgi:hypothetical protein